MTNQLVDRLRYHVSGAIERGEGVAIAALELPALEPHCGSWVIMSRQTPENAICETFSRRVAESYLRAGHTVLTAAKYLGDLNAKIKATN